jgi:hypothetical protein
MPHLGLVIVFGIFATTLPQTAALGRLPLQFLLKNEVGVTREQMAAFFFWSSFAWYLKPAAGILTDAFPFFAILDLAARSTPKGCEGLGCSLMLSVFTVAMYGADVVGSYLADHKGHSLTSSI